MYKVFIYDSTVIFTSNKEEINKLSKAAVTVNSDDHPNDLFDHITGLCATHLPQSYLIKSANVEDVWSGFKKNYNLRIAGGGLVIREQQLLCIYRNDKWDLPKGHLDEGESITDCAMREVTEETGVDQLSITSDPFITYHTYEYEGQKVLKETHWFMMATTCTVPTTPQLEEGITAVKWIPTNDFGVFKENTYTSILALMEIANL